jgi:hypothetical protein
MPMNIGQRKVRTIGITVLIGIAAFHRLFRLENYGYLLYSSRQCHIHSWVLRHQNCVSVDACSLARPAFIQLIVELILVYAADRHIDLTVLSP